MCGWHSAPGGWFSQANSYHLCGLPSERRDRGEEPACVSKGRHYLNYISHSSSSCTLPETCTQLQWACLLHSAPVGMPLWLPGLCSGVGGAAIPSPDQSGSSSWQALYKDVVFHVFRIRTKHPERVAPWEQVAHGPSGL